MTQNQISLYELNSLVRNCLENNLNGYYWIIAETSDVRVSGRHCYLELIEKDSHNTSTIAKARAIIWSNIYGYLKALFKENTGQEFRSGLKVKVLVNITFSEIYGYSLTIHEIDPLFTLGDQARKKAEIIKNLEDNGLIDLNKELKFPTIVKRLAVISSVTAAGYEDFCNQLNNNEYGFKFYLRLFPSILQGEKTEASILDALEKIYNNEDLFDAIIIIRGGGASSDLSAFDSYNIGAAISQSPLPVITGIGHERDQSVADIVAHTRCKTPTAVAEFLIVKMIERLSDLESIRLALSKKLYSVSQNQSNNLSICKEKLKLILKNKISRKFQLLSNLEYRNYIALKKHYNQTLNRLDYMQNFIRNKVQIKLMEERNDIFQIQEKLKFRLVSKVDKQRVDLHSIEKQIHLLSPMTILSKGYTYTLMGGKLVLSSKNLKSGDVIETVFANGNIKSVVE